MPHTRRHDEKLKAEVLRHVLEHGNVSAAARHFNLPRPTVQSWVNSLGATTAPGGRVEKSGAPTDPPGVPIDNRNGDGSVSIVELDKPRTISELFSLFDIDERMWIPTGFKANEWQGFYKLAKSEGGGHRKVKLYQSKATFKRVMNEELEQKLTAWLEEHVAPLPKKSLPLAEAAYEGDERYILWGLWDTHLGMYAWNTEVGHDYDLNIACTRVKNSIDDMVVRLADRSGPIRRIVMPVGNDFLHFDNVRQTTTFGDHYLDCDSRFAKVYVAGLECLVYMVERALEITDEIELVYVPGNHDYATSFTLVAALQQRFLKEPRVKVNLSANPHKVVTFGTTCIGLTHGKVSDRQRLGTIFSSSPEFGSAWANATWREVQVGHTHQRREDVIPGMSPHNGYIVRVNPCLCNTDYWHHSGGLMGEPVKSVEAWEYEEYGYVGSYVTWARDDAR